MQSERLTTEVSPPQTMAKAFSASSVMLSQREWISQGSANMTVWQII